MNSRALWPATILAFASACGPEGASPGDLPSILLISIDTLRADHLGCYGYDPYAEPVSPAIDALAREGVRFTRCFVPRGQTAPALCSLMVGKYPSAHGVRDNGQDFAPGQTTIAEHLGALGYETVAFVAQMPASPAGHPARGFDLYVEGAYEDDGSPVLTQGEADVAMVGESLRWLDRTEPGQAPFLAWIHLFDVHKPYSPLPPYDRMFTGDYDGPLAPDVPGHPELMARVERATRTGERLEGTEQRFLLGLYDGSVRAVDDHVGRILAKLEERGLSDETLVILTSDHGEELGQHRGYYFHGNSVYDATLHVPLVLRWPGVLPAGASFEHLVQNVDLFPTLMDWIGTDPPVGLEGVSFEPWLGARRSADAPPSTPPREHVFVEWQDLIYGVRTLDEKYVSNPEGVHPNKPPYFESERRGFAIECEELYDLAGDPDETRNVSAERAGRVEALRRVLAAFRDRPGTVERWEAPDEDEVLTRLRALGYAGATSRRADVLFGARDCGAGE